jgi:hypothetical protein
MIPSVLSSQVKKGVHGVMDRLLGEDGGVFKGPYLISGFNECLSLIPSLP